MRAIEGEQRERGSPGREDLCGRRVVINRARLEIKHHPSHHGAADWEAGGESELWDLQHVSVFTGRAGGKSLQPGAAQDLCPAPLTKQRGPEQRRLYALTC